MDLINGTITKEIRNFSIDKQSLYGTTFLENSNGILCYNPSTNPSANPSANPSTNSNPNPIQIDIDSKWTSHNVILCAPKVNACTVIIIKDDNNNYFVTHHTPQDLKNHLLYKSLFAQLVDNKCKAISVCFITNKPESFIVLAELYSIQINEIILNFNPLNYYEVEGFSIDVVDINMSNWNANRAIREPKSYFVFVDIANGDLWFYGDKDKTSNITNNKGSSCYCIKNVFGTGIDNDKQIEILSVARIKYLSGPYTSILDVTNYNDFLSLVNKFSFTSMLELPLIGLPLIGLPLIGLPLIGLPLIGLPLI